MKNYKLNLIMILILFVLGGIACYNYIKNENKNRLEHEKYYNECIEGNTYYCSYYSEPYKKRDTFNTFLYITSIYDTVSNLQILAPLFLIIPSYLYFNKLIRNGYLKNSITRIGYKKSMITIYKDCLISTFIFPIFILMMFLISYLISGNFDFNIGAYDYHFDVAEVRNIYQMIIYMLILLICFILNEIFWINLGLYNCKYNKNKYVGIIASFIEFVLLFAIIEVIDEKFLRKTIIYENFSLSGFWSFTYNVRYIVLIMSLIIAIVSSIILYLTYKNKEEVLMEINKWNIYF